MYGHVDNDDKINAGSPISKNRTMILTGLYTDRVHIHACTNLHIGLYGVSSNYLYKCGGCRYLPVEVFLSLFLLDL